MLLDSPSVRDNARVQQLLRNNNNTRGEAASSLWLFHFTFVVPLFMLLSVKSALAPSVSFLILPKLTAWWSPSRETKLVMYLLHIGRPAATRSTHLFQIQILPCSPLHAEMYTFYFRLLPLQGRGCNYLLLNSPPLSSNPWTNLWRWNNHESFLQKLTTLNLKHSWKS